MIKLAYRNDGNSYILNRYPKTQVFIFDELSGKKVAYKFKSTDKKKESVLMDYYFFRLTKVPILKFFVGLLNQKILYNRLKKFEKTLD